MKAKVKSILFGFGIFLAIFILTVPFRFSDYHHILEKTEILKTLLQNRSIHLDKIYDNSSIYLENCFYDNLITENRIYYNKKMFATEPNIYHPTDIIRGGEYYPTECKAVYSVAIIVPFRNREHQLNYFLHYMHNFLRNQLIHYKIFIVEQADEAPFNRAKLLNIGSMQAIREKFPCLILHDIDSLPTSLGNLYACNRHARHVASSVDKYRFNLPYITFFGVVSSIDSASFMKINGLSNRFEGWGGEDDDLYMRLYMERVPIVRYERSYSEYITLNHRQAPRAEGRHSNLYSKFHNYKIDGINTISIRNLQLIKFKLYTLIKVETKSI